VGFSHVGGNISRNKSSSTVGLGFHPYHFNQTFMAKDLKFQILNLNFGTKSTVFELGFYGETQGTTIKF
jgi:hypothetical protein